MTGAAAIEAASGFKEAREGQRCCGRTIPGVLSFLSSLLSITYCILLSVRTAAIQERVVALEMGHKGDLYYHSSPSFSTEQLNSVVQERVDELLSQRTYEHLAKLRIAREAPSECGCPAGRKITRFYELIIRGFAVV
ncbi:COPA1 protein, partial [Polypterus senegalus]|nr:COPA1 protein [Polypterus senegalus]